MHGALAPAQPDLAPGLQLRQCPFAREAFRQPFGPVALRQAGVDIGLAVLPLTGLDTRAHVERDRLTIRQGQACVKSLRIAACVKTEVYIGEGQRRGVKRLHRDLAVEQRQMRDHLHLPEHLLGIERAVVVHRQALNRPCTILVLDEAEL